MGYSHLQQKSGFVLLADSDRRKNSDYITLVDSNGLIQVVPRPRRKSRLAGPFKLLLVFAVLLTVFKSLALLNVGVVDYEDELAVLREGNAFEQAGAFVLSIDPLTMIVYKQIGPLLK